MASGRRRTEARIEAAHLHRQRSRLDAAFESYQRALAEAETPVERCVALGELGRMLQSLGRLKEARARHVEAIALARSLGMAHREALERSLHARAAHRAGALDEAARLHAIALELHLALGDRRLAAAERGHLAYTRHEGGALDEAEALFRASIEGLADVGDVFLEHVERVLLARLLIECGRLEEARLELGLARGLLGGEMPARLELTWRLVRGMAALEGGDLASAYEELAAALARGTSHVEVGFEALAPAWLAWVEHRLGAPDAAAHLARAAERVGRIEHPGIAAALAQIRARVLGEAPPPIDAAILGCSSDARRAVALGGGAPALRIAADGRAFAPPGGATVDLGRRSVPRRLLAALADARREAPGRVLSRSALLSAGWPGEKIRPDAADKRLRTGIWALRKAGLGELLLTRDDGYLLDPRVPIGELT